VAEHPPVGEQQHPGRVGECDTSSSNPFQHNGFQLWQAGRDAVEMVLGAQFGELTQPSWQPRRRVEVDQPLVVRVREGMAQRPEAGMPHGPHDQGRKGGKVLHDLRLGAHQVTPSAAAAATPERAPSSWNPQP
jgi:hypothetical protein